MASHCDASASASPSASASASASATVAVCVFVWVWAFVKYYIDILDFACRNIYVHIFQRQNAPRMKNLLCDFILWGSVCTNTLFLGQLLPLGGMVSDIYLKSILYLDITHF